MFDLILKNGLILDGSGNEGYVADVAVKDGKIAAVGKDLTNGEEILDITGLAVSPGWIDSHSHSDNAFRSHPDVREKIEQGITMSVTGQCGGSAAPSKEYTSEAFMAEMTQMPMGSGAVMLVGHNTLRTMVMQKEKRDPTPEELEEMKRLLAEAMDAGAIGMSFGLYYVPGCYSKTEEAVALAKVVAEKGGLLAAHIRNESDKLEESVDEYLEIIKQSGCRAIISHHKAGGKENWGKVRKTLQMVDEANAAGADIYVDVYPYIASHTSLRARFVPSKFHPAGTTSVIKLLEDPEFCQRLKTWSRDLWGDEKIDWCLITQSPKMPELEGMMLYQAAEYVGIADQFDAIYHLLRKTNGALSGCFFSMCEEDVEYVMAHPRAMICTDSSVAKESKKFHPRLRASFPRALGHYVRERKVVSLPEMIRKMTSLPAAVYGLSKKGHIAEGFDADLCVFDPETICETNDYVHCELPNKGLTYVIVDGKVVVKDGIHNGIRAAKVYRKWEI